MPLKDPASVIALVFFGFRTDWEEWKPYWDKKKLKNIALETIELERQSVEWDFKDMRNRISNEA